MRLPNSCWTTKRLRSFRDRPMGLRVMIASAWYCVAATQHSNAPSTGWQPLVSQRLLLARECEGPSAFVAEQVLRELDGARRVVEDLLDDVPRTQQIIFIVDFYPGTPRCAY